MTFHSDWTRLWELARRLAEPTRAEPTGADPAGVDPASVLEPIGLFLENPDRPNAAWDYPATPAGSTTFAATGGNGVHFSALPAGNGDGGTAIVMTVPMAFDAPNQILGADLPEFLALGCRTGYFSLERLAYEWGRAELVSRLRTSPPPDDATQARLLQALTDEFDLRPWPDVAGRLAELDAQHRPRVRLRGES